MSSDPDTRSEATVELKERAQAAGSALREMLGKDVDSMQQDKGRVAFDPDDYADILGGVMQKFAEVSVQTPRTEETWYLSEGIPITTSRKRSVLGKGGHHPSIYYI